MIEIKGLKNIQESFRTRQVKYGGYAALISLALVVALILINLIMGQIPLQFDMTESKLFSLSNQSIQVAEQITSPVTIYGLWRPGEENGDVTAVVDLYLARNRNIRYEAVDLDRNPGLLAKFDQGGEGVNWGSVIVEGAKGFRVIPSHEMYEIGNYYNQRTITGIAIEYRITSALIYVETGVTPVIYEIMGHEENSLVSLSLADMVERENFSLKQLNLIPFGIPADASALIINSPKTDISRVEADMILRYLEQGGRLLLLADYRTQDLSMLNDILSSYGIALDYGVLVENDPTYSLGNRYLAMAEMLEHDITKPLLENFTPVIVPFGMGLSETEAKRRSVGVFPLLASSGSSWLRSDMEDMSSSMIPTDIGGPIITSVAVVDPLYVREDGKQTRIVVIGSGAIIQNITNFGQIPSNLDFFMNSITWLEDRPEAIAARSKSIFLLPLMMSGLQTGIFAGIFVVLLPLAFFISGLVIWLRRRHL